MVLASKLNISDLIITAWDSARTFRRTDKEEVLMVREFDYLQ